VSVKASFPNEESSKNALPPHFKEFYFFSKFFFEFRFFTFSKFALPQAGLFVPLLLKKKTSFVA